MYSNILCYASKVEHLRININLWAFSIFKTCHELGIFPIHYFFNQSIKQNKTFIYWIFSIYRSISLGWDHIPNEWWWNPFESYCDLSGVLANKRLYMFCHTLANCIHVLFPTNATSCYRVFQIIIRPPLPKFSIILSTIGAPGAPGAPYE